MNKVIGLPLAVLTVLICVSPVYANKVVIIDNIPATETIPIETGTVYEQRFTAATTEIGLIDVYISSINSEVCPELRFGLGTQSDVLVDKVVDVSTAKGGDFYSIGFEPITTNPGEDYWFGLMRVDKNLEACMSLGTNSNTYLEGELVANNEVTNDTDLVFRIAYDQPVREYVAFELQNELLQKYASQKVFWWIYGLLIVGMSGMIVYGWKRR